MRDLAEILDSPWLAVPVAVALIMGYLTVNVLFSVWMERKASARFQLRLGPMEVGPHGTLQTIADTFKLLSKELITPSHVNRGLYFLAPVLAFAPIPALIALLPFSEHAAFTDLRISIVMLLALSGLGVISIFAAGWGSNNKFALLGAMRSIAQGLSYEIPIVLAILSVVLMTGTLNLADISAAQTGLPFVFFQPLAAVIYFIAALAETNRAPFDIPEAESELVAGFHTEYSGMRFAMFFFAEYSHMAIVAAVASTLFLGGWHGPLLPGTVWFLLKIYTLIFIMMWVRWTFPRLRFDQLMRFSWVVLVPLALINLLVTAVVIKL